MLKSLSLFDNNIIIENYTNHQIVTELIGYNGKVLFRTNESPAVLQLDPDLTAFYGVHFIRIRQTDMITQKKLWLQPFHLKLSSVSK